MNRDINKLIKAEVEKLIKTEVEMSKNQLLVMKRDAIRTDFHSLTSDVKILMAVGTILGGGNPFFLLNLDFISNKRRNEVIQKAEVKLNSLSALPNSSEKSSAISKVLSEAKSEFDAINQEPKSKRVMDSVKLFATSTYDKDILGTKRLVGSISRIIKRPFTRRKSRNEWQEQSDGLRRMREPLLPSAYEQDLQTRVAGRVSVGSQQIPDIGVGFSGKDSTKLKENKSSERTSSKGDITVEELASLLPKAPTHPLPNPKRFSLRKKNNNKKADRKQAKPLLGL